MAANVPNISYCPTVAPTDSPTAAPTGSGSGSGSGTGTGSGSGTGTGSGSGTLTPSGSHSEPLSLPTADAGILLYTPLNRPRTCPWTVDTIGPDVGE